jgi:Ser/Thr protein kinase RdoA (MazF antagonist)
MGALAREVLAAYPSPLRGRLEPLGNRGGFSGARLWRLHTPGGLFCLRAAAPAEAPAHVAGRHRLMTLACRAGLGFVPVVLTTPRAETVVQAGGRCWELMQWLPGRADYRAAPSPARLRAAAQALAAVHRVWEPLGGEVVSPCPAVASRLEAVAAPRPRRPDGDPLLARLDAAVARWLPRVPEMLGEAAGPCRVQPCLRDVWHDHLLYEGERLTGLVDYASVAPDAVATDLARLLGSLVEDDSDGWRLGLEAYREVRGLSPGEERLARLLDRTGVLVGLANWLSWLTDPGRTFEDRSHARRRVEDLLGRVERWPAPGPFLI